MSTVTTSPGTAQTAAALRRLYFVRFAFAIVWAVLTMAVATELTPFAAALFVLYPLFDAGAAVHDMRSSRTTGAPLRVNIAISTLAAAGLGVASASGVPAMLRVWGAWAIIAGAVQLAVAIPRRAMGGQWPMIISGGISVLAGTSFVLSAAAENPVLGQAAGYAVPGAVFFLISAFRLGRTAKGAPTAG